jgi:sarcosine oxidase, subunit beta
MTTDAVVVGAGVIGASVALELARRGFDVTVVDAGEQVGGASTSASSTVVRFHYSTFEGVSMAYESMLRWTAWAEHLGTIDPGGLAQFKQVGAIVYEAPNFPAERVRAMFDRVGVVWEDWSPQRSRDLRPVFDPSRFWPPKLVTDDTFFDDPEGGATCIFTPEGGYIDDPQLAAQNLMVAAKANGARFHFRTRVTAVLRDGARVSGVELSDGTARRASIVVNCAGPWSAEFNRLADVTDDMAITTRPLRQEVHVVPAPAGFGLDDGGLCVTDGDLGTYFRPQVGGTFLVGGLEPACDPMDWREGGDDCNPHATPELWEANTWRAARRMPTTELPLAPHGLGALYDVTDDWIPIYDRSSLDGFYMAVGTSGNQFKNAPTVGEAIAELIAAVESGHDHDRNPVYLKLSRSGHEINLGHYSRLREVNPDSTNSVLG